MSDRRASAADVAREKREAKQAARRISNQSDHKSGGDATEAFSEMIGRSSEIGDGDGVLRPELIVPLETDADREAREAREDALLEQLEEEEAASKRRMEVASTNSQAADHFAPSADGRGACESLVNDDRASAADVAREKREAKQAARRISNQSDHNSGGDATEAFSEMIGRSSEIGGGDGVLRPELIVPLETDADREAREAREDALLEQLEEEEAASKRRMEVASTNSQAADHFAPSIDTENVAERGACENAMFKRFDGPRETEIPLDVLAESDIPPELPITESPSVVSEKVTAEAINDSLTQKNTIDNTSARAAVYWPLPNLGAKLEPEVKTDTDVVKLNDSPCSAPKVLRGAASIAAAFAAARLAEEEADTAVAAVEIPVKPPTLKKLFKMFTKGSLEMDGKTFAKFAKDSKIIGKKIKVVDCDIAFAKVKERGYRTITYEQFRYGLADLAHKKGTDFTTLVSKICKPSTGPKIAARIPSFNRHHDDPAMYTGVHAKGGPSTVGDGIPQFSELMDRSECDVRGVSLKRRQDLRSGWRGGRPELN